MQRFILVLCLTFLALMPKLKAQGNTKDRLPQKFLLSIGIGNYEDKRWPSLQFPGKDASDFDQALSPYFTSRMLLSDHKRDHAIQRDEIWLALKQLAAQNRNEDDTVIVYISSHGTLAQAGDAAQRRIQKYLVTGDTVYDQVAQTGLMIPEVLDFFRSLKSRRKALIIDACYSGGGKAHLSQDMLKFLAKQKSGALQAPVDSADESTAFYTASAWGEEAQEDLSLKNGVYTHFLLKALSKDLNGDGATQLSEAHTQASEWVTEFTRGAQHPSALVEIVGRDPVIVQGELTQSVRPMLLAWRNDLKNYFVRWNGKEMGSLKKGVVFLPEGKGTLELIDKDATRVISRNRVQIQANETYLLESFLNESRPFQINLGFGQESFRQAHLRQRLAPKPLSFAELKLTYEGLIDFADLSFSMQYFDPTLSVVNLEESLLGQSLGLQEERQKLELQQYQLLLKREAALAFLTDYNRQWQSSVFAAGGPSYLVFNRNLIDLKTKERASSLGLSVELGWQIYWRFRHLNWQLAARMTRFQNTLTDGPSQAELLGISTGFGLNF